MTPQARTLSRKVLFAVQAHSTEVNKLHTQLAHALRDELPSEHVLRLRCQLNGAGLALHAVIVDAITAGASPTQLPTRGVSRDLAIAVATRRRSRR